MNIIRAYEKLHAEMCKRDLGPNIQDDSVFLTVAMAQQGKLVVNIQIQVSNDVSHSPFHISPIELAALVSYLSCIKGFFLEKRSGTAVQIGYCEFELEEEATRLERRVFSAAVDHGAATKTLHWAFGKLIPQYKQLVANVCINWDDNDPPPLSTTALPPKRLSNAPTKAPPRRCSSPRPRLAAKKKNMLLIFKNIILRVIAKARAARVMAEREAAHFAALTISNKAEAAKRAAIRESAKRANEKKQPSAARPTRLPPFPTIVAPPAPPTPRRVSEKAASLEALAASKAKRAVAAKADAEAREARAEARRLAREIGGS